MFSRMGSSNAAMAMFPGLRLQPQATQHGGSASDKNDDLGASPEVPTQLDGAAAAMQVDPAVR